MAKKRAKPAGLANVSDYRHDTATRKNNPPATLAAEGSVPELPRAEYAYSPRRPPGLRFDSSGDADKLPAVLEKARTGKLNDEEVQLLANALRTQEPWLEWAGKRELPGFAVDPVALHIHERVSAQAILQVAARQDVERSLFADPEQEYQDAVKFYQHDVDWANRLILGDSLQVMASLARREDLAGKVQMMYLDPPYGIKYGSNFQPEVGKRDVKDKEADLTREPEMVRAYRDTWHLGVHSYLTYLRDRLILARELLADSGSIFVQIGEENLHRVRLILDEVFGVNNFVSGITFRTTSALADSLLGRSADYLLWYCRDREKVKFRRIYQTRTLADDVGGRYTRVEEPSGARRFMTAEERLDEHVVPEGCVVYRHDNITSQDASKTGQFPVLFEGHTFTITQGHWKTNEAGMKRLLAANRLGAPTKNSLAYVRYFADFPLQTFSNVWTDTQTGAFTDTKRYVVQTNTKVIERCLLMTTDPGDLVLDPTCGSGTTAYAAEQWGRRWITIDTSRVAVAIARQRLLTSKYDYYQLRSATTDEQAACPANTWLTDPSEKIDGPCTLHCKTVSHITLKSVAQNTNLDPIFAHHEPVLDARLTDCNVALTKVPGDLRTRLSLKLAAKEKRDGKRAVTDADRRRWLLPKGGDPFEHWTVPFDTDPDWPAALQTAVMAYRAAWRARMDEVNACVEANASQEELFDQPKVVKGVVRVSGPFTVEAVQPAELNLSNLAGGFDGAPTELEGTFTSTASAGGLEVRNVEAYLDQMTKLLKVDGVRFPDNKQMAFSRLGRISDQTGIHAEGRWVVRGESDADADGDAMVGVVFGPQYGPFTVPMLEKLIKPARRRYDALVIAAFNFTAEVQDLADNHQLKDFRVHVAHIRPDVNPGMAGLLKEQPGSQLFTVFGQPRTRVEPAGGEYRVVMEGVDIYDPVNNVVRSSDGSKVAAWFLDGDYDGRTFCITQAFFPDQTAWEKLSKALGGVVDAQRFEALSGTTSLPFPAGKHACCAVKVIDPRGNEVMQVHRLGGV